MGMERQQRPALCAFSGRLLSSGIGRPVGKFLGEGGRGQLSMLQSLGRERKALWTLRQCFSQGHWRTRQI